MAQHIVSLKPPSSSKKSITKRKSNNNDKSGYNPICWRFPQLMQCGCTRPCRLAVKTVKIFEIIPGLYVGPVHGAYKHKYLYDKNVRYILNVSNEKYVQNDKLFKYLQIKIEDAVTTEIIKYFKETNKFIENALSNKEGVYVHCRAGISRSPSFIMAYLIWKQNVNYEKADKIVGRVHPDAHPNSSFVKQLQEYHKIIELDKYNGNKHKKNEEKNDK